MNKITIISALVIILVTAACVLTLIYQKQIGHDYRQLCVILAVCITAGCWGSAAVLGVFLLWSYAIKCIERNGEDYNGGKK